MADQVERQLLLMFRYVYIYKTVCICVCVVKVCLIPACIYIHVWTLYVFMITCVVGVT